jgi:hypothetical protein
LLMLLHDAAAGRLHAVDDVDAHCCSSIFSIFFPSTMLLFPNYLIELIVSSSCRRRISFVPRWCS